MLNIHDRAVRDTDKKVPDVDELAVEGPCFGGGRGCFHSWSEELLTLKTLMSKIALLFIASL